MCVFVCLSVLQAPRPAAPQTPPSRQPYEGSSPERVPFITSAPRPRGGYYDYGSPYFPEMAAGPGHYLPDPRMREMMSPNMSGYYPSPPAAMFRGGGPKELQGSGGSVSRTFYRPFKVMYFCVYVWWMCN